MQEVIMPTLQVRDLPEDVYVNLVMMAKQQNRSIAQQTVTLLRNALGLHANNKTRRKGLLERIAEKTFPDTGTVDSVSLVREDRNR
jgi:plasmid stability protein